MTIETIAKKSKEDLKTMKVMTKSKPEKGSLTKEFYKTFWDKFKDPYIMSFRQTFPKKALRIP